MRSIQLHQIIKTFFINTLKGSRDIFFGNNCFICKDKIIEHTSNSQHVCSNCWNKIKKSSPPFCHKCGRHLSDNLHENICSSCLNQKLHFDRAISPCLYEGNLKELIHKFKYENKDYLGKDLSKLLIDFINFYRFDIDFIDCVIPIPLHKTRLREREYNQSEILANFFAKEFSKPLNNFSLIRDKPTKKQTELEIEKRFNNIKESFKVVDAKPIINKNILLVDDVLTTGATASEAALTLKTAGANIVFVLTLAH